MNKSIIDVLLKKSLSIIEKNSNMDEIKRPDVHMCLNREFRFDKELSKMIIRELKRKGKIKNTNRGIVINTNRGIVINKRRKVQR